MIFTTLAIALCSCGSEPVTQPHDQQPSPVPTPVQEDDSTVLRSALSRDAAPDVPATNLDALVADNNAFALDLFGEVGSQNGNLITSPLSVSLALAMAYAGAKGDTASEMADVLRFSLPEEQLQPAMNALDLSLESHQGSLDGKSVFTLSLSNALWLDQQLQVLQSFLDTLAINYGAGVHVTDFTNTEAAALSINAWVNKATAGNIPQLVQPTDLEGTVLALVNAIYFKANWDQPFNPSNTSAGTFNLEDGGQVSASMMSESLYTDYVDADGFVAVELPYAGGSAAMLLIVPDAGHFHDIGEQLDADFVAGVESALSPKEVVLSLPKWQADTRLSLKSVLVDLGMYSPFSSEADFSGITGSTDISLKDVIQKAHIEVDEYGTEAAAATAVIGVGASPDQVELPVDRPFYYVIRDVETASILFVGKVVSPLTAN